MEIEFQLREFRLFYHLYVFFSCANIWILASALYAIARYLCNYSWHIMTVKERESMTLTTWVKTLYNNNHQRQKKNKNTHTKKQQNKQWQENVVSSFLNQGKDLYILLHKQTHLKSTLAVIFFSCFNSEQRLTTSILKLPWNRLTQNYNASFEQDTLGSK